MPKTPNYVTKSDLIEAISGLERRLNKYLDKKLDIKLDSTFRKYRDDVLTKMDGVMKELETKRDESSLGTYQTRELRERVDNHEKRIKKLETS